MCPHELDVRSSARPLVRSSAGKILGDALSSDRWDQVAVGCQGRGVKADRQGMLGVPPDGAFEEGGEELSFRAAPPPTPERMTAILARVHDAILARDPDAELDLDPALATCVQQSLRGPSLAAAAPDTEPPPCTVSAFGMHLHVDIPLPYERGSLRATLPPSPGEADDLDRRSAARR